MRNPSLKRPLMGFAAAQPILRFAGDDSNFRNARQAATPACASPVLSERFAEARRHNRSERRFATGLRTAQESQVERYEYQDDSDIHHQTFPELVSEKREVHTDYDGRHRHQVKHDSDRSAHFQSPLLQASRCTAVRRRLRKSYTISSAKRPRLRPGFQAMMKKFMNFRQQTLLHRDGVPIVRLSFPGGPRA